MKTGEKGCGREGGGLWDLYRCRTEMACSVPFVKTVNNLYICICQYLIVCGFYKLSNPGPHHPQAPDFAQSVEVLYAAR